MTAKKPRVSLSELLSRYLSAEFSVLSEWSNSIKAKAQFDGGTKVASLYLCDDQSELSVTLSRLRLAREAGAAGITPATVEIDAAPDGLPAYSCVHIREYVEGTPLSREEFMQDTLPMAKIASRLHRLSVREDRDTLFASSFGHEERLRSVAIASIVPQTGWPELNALADRVRDAWEKVKPELSASDLIAPDGFVPVHGDFGWHNMVRSPSGNLQVLDFDSANVFDMALDFIWPLEHLDSSHASEWLSAYGLPLDSHADVIRRRDGLAIRRKVEVASQMLYNAVYSITGDLIDGLPAKRMVPARAFEVANWHLDSQIRA